jgi:hypothetical protein
MVATKVPMRQSTAARRAYRLYFRGATAMQEQRHDAVLASDEEARELVVLMLDDRPTYPCAEVWEAARLVCTVRRGE